jgi:hypothetical protein
MFATMSRVPFSAKHFLAFLKRLKAISMVFSNSK